MRLDRFPVNAVAFVKSKTHTRLTRQAPSAYMGREGRFHLKPPRTDFAKKRRACGALPARFVGLITGLGVEG